MEDDFDRVSMKLDPDLTDYMSQLFSETKTIVDEPSTDLDAATDGQLGRYFVDEEPHRWTSDLQQFTDPTDILFVSEAKVVVPTTSRRKRGRPAITDPVVKAKRRQLRQQVASRKYRLKAKKTESDLIDTESELNAANIQLMTQMTGLNGQLSRVLALFASCDKRSQLKRGWKRRFNSCLTRIAKIAKL